MSMTMPLVRFPRYICPNPMSKKLNKYAVPLLLATYSTKSVLKNQDIRMDLSLQ